MLILMRMKSIWVSGLFAMCLCTVLETFACLWCIPFVQTVYHVSLQQATWASALVLLGIALGSPLWGWLWICWTKRRTLMSIATITCWLSLLLVIHVKLTVLELFIALFITGFSSSIYMLSFTITKEAVDVSMLATAIGLINVFSMILGSVILQPLVGYLLRWHALSHGHANLLVTSDYRYALMVLPWCVITGLLLIHRVDPRWNKENKQSLSPQQP